MRALFFIFTVCFFLQTTSAQDCYNPYVEKQLLKTISDFDTPSNQIPCDDVYGYFAATLGLPGIVNLNIGGYSDVIGGQFGLSAIHLFSLLTNKDDDDDDGDDDDSDGSSFFVGQANLNVRLFSTENFLLAASLAGGTATYKDGDAVDYSTCLYYYGPAAHFMLYSVFLETGWAWGRDFAIPKAERTTIQFPLFQIGYVARF